MMQLAPGVKPSGLPWVHPRPVPGGSDWLRFVGLPQTEAELDRLRQSVVCGAPYGSAEWTRLTVSALGLEFSLGPRGRPLHRPELQSPNPQPNRDFSVNHMRMSQDVTLFLPYFFSGKIGLLFLTHLPTYHVGYLSVGTPFSRCL
jgi:hypothetical protein